MAQVARPRASLAEDGWPIQPWIPPENATSCWYREISAPVTPGRRRPSCGGYGRPTRVWMFVWSNRPGASPPDEPFVGGLLPGDYTGKRPLSGGPFTVGTGKVVSPFAAILYPLCPVHPVGGTDHPSSAAAGRFDPSLRRLWSGPAERTGVGIQAVHGHHGFLRPRILGASSNGPLFGAGRPCAEPIDPSRGGSRTDHRHGHSHRPGLLGRRRSGRGSPASGAAPASHSADHGRRIGLGGRNNG